MKKDYEHKQEKGYNRGKELFFWFDENGLINKVYDRRNKIDYFRDNEIFPAIFKAAVSKLEIIDLQELKARMLETDEPYNGIADKILLEKMKAELEKKSREEK